MIICTVALSYILPARADIESNVGDTTGTSKPSNFPTWKRWLTDSITYQDPRAFATSGSSDPHRIR